MKFQQNQTVTTNGKSFKIISVLGVGGQGEVYLAESEGKKYALKIYIEDQSREFRDNLKNNIDKGSPARSFLWPREIVEGEGYFGYLMDLRPDRFVSFVSYINAKSRFADQKTLLTWCIELCLSFKKLHEKGYSYQDLNDGSFFLDPQNGDLLICDNDNVTADKRNLGILGKMKYMAPEIVRGDIDKRTGERQMPDVHSDRFSLAVILFMALCIGNPFEGERLKNYVIVDEKAEYEMYGSDPLFVYHKHDKSNRPIRGYHKSMINHWNLMPIYIKEAFHRTFTDGLSDRENSRTTELEWIRLLTRYRDELYSCSCGNQYAVGLFEKKEKASQCPICSTENVIGIGVLYIGKNRIVIEPDKKLYSNHLDKYSSNYNEVVGEIVRNKKDPSRWGIRITVGGDIQIKDTNGNVKTVAAGGVIPIIKDLKIKFNENTIGEIKYE